MKKIFLLAFLSVAIFQSCRKIDIDNQLPSNKHCTLQEFGSDYFELAPSLQITYNDQGLIDYTKRVQALQGEKHEAEMRYFYNDAKQLVKSEDNDETGPSTTTYIWENGLLIKAVNTYYDMLFEYDQNKRLIKLTMPFGEDSYNWTYTYNTAWDLTEYMLESKGSYKTKDVYRYSYPDKPDPSVQTLVKDKGLPFNIANLTPWFESEPVKFEHFNNSIGYFQRIAIFNAVLGSKENGFVSSVSWSGSDSFTSDTTGIRDVRKFYCK